MVNFFLAAVKTSFFFCSLQVRSFTPMWFAKHFFGFILFVIH